jgi:NAD(P)H-flavin reductase
MIKPARTAVFLGRPVSVFAAGPVMPGLTLDTAFHAPFNVTFVVAKKGAGTEAICAMRPGEEAELIGPVGNTFADFLPDTDNGTENRTDENADASTVALVGGGIGVAPVYMFARELRRAKRDYAVFAGFKSRDTAIPDEDGDCPGGNVPLSITKTTEITEDGSLGSKGLVTDFLVPARYAAVFACGPLPMLHAVYQKCAASGVPCFVSMEKRMACGVGACLGCRINTKKGNKRCCKDGPVFDAGEIDW